MADKEIQRDCEIEIIEDSDSENANLISQKSTNSQILFQTGWTKSSSNTIPHGWGDIPSPPPGGEIEKFNTGDSIRQVLSKWTPPTWSTPERPVIIFHNNKKAEVACVYIDNNTVQLLRNQRLPSLPSIKTRQQGSSHKKECTQERTL